MEVLKGGIPSLHRIEHAEPFRPAVGTIYAIEDMFDVPREVLIALERLRIGLPHSVAEREKRGSEFGVVVGHDFVPHTHHLGVNCWNPNEFGPRRKGEKCMKVSHLLVALALLMTATVATAQHQHAVPNTIKVDGAKHPEQIPDEVAYFNYFRGRSVSEGAILTVEERHHLVGGIQMLQLSQKDELQFLLALAQLRTKLDALYKSHSAKAEVGRATARDLWYGPGGIAQIVGETRTKLAEVLSPEGLKSVEGAVQEMRKNTRFETGGVQ